MDSKRTISRNNVKATDGPYGYLLKNYNDN